MQFEDEGLRADPITDYRSLKEDSRGRMTDLFSLVNSDRTQANGLKLPQRKYRLDIRNRFFPQRVVGHWITLHREVIRAKSVKAQGLTD